MTSRLIDLASAANACGCVQVGARDNSTILELEVSTEGATIPTGTYSLVRSGGQVIATATYIVNDDKGTRVDAMSGSLTISESSPSTTAGTFDLAFPSGDHLTGNFSAPICNEPAGAGATTCQ